MVWVLGSTPWGLGLRVLGSGFGVWALGFIKVLGARLYGQGMNLGIPEVVDLTLNPKP